MTGTLDPVTLHPKRSSAIWLLVVFSAFEVGAIWMAVSGRPMGYACAAIFAVGIAVAVIQLVPRSAYLRIDHEGLTVRSLFRTSSVPWSLVDRFCVVTVSRTGVKVGAMVGWNYVASYDRARLGRRAALLVGGCEGALPDTYGKNAEELAAFLNDCLDRARAGGGKPAGAPDG